MDMTLAVGRIMSSANSKYDDAADEEEDTMGMDMTTAIGGIIKNGQASPRTLSKHIMEEEADKPNSPRRAITTAILQASPLRKTSPNLSGCCSTSIGVVGLPRKRLAPQHWASGTRCNQA